MLGFPGGSGGKVSACSAGDPGSIPGSGRSPGEGNGYPLQYSYLENLMDGGAWWATVHGVARVGHDWVTSTFTVTLSLNLLQYFCFLFWFFGCKACGILAPQPGIKPVPPALEAEVSTTRQPENSLYVFFLSKNLINKTYLTYSLSYKPSQRVKFKLQRIIIIVVR